MKKLLLSALVASAATAGVYAQGTIAVDNTANTDTTTTATSNGLVFTTAANGTVSLENNGVTFTVLGGPSAGSLTAIGTLPMDGFGGGVEVDHAGGTYAVPGVALNGTATLEIMAWEGNFASYAAAIAGNANVGEVIFQNATGGGGNPPATPVDLVGMPALVLAPAPEPTTIALGGLGAAALMLFRRRK